MLTQEELLRQWYSNKNAITGRYYLGLGNQIMLDNAWCKSKERMTFFQAKENGYRIKPWVKGVQIKYESYIPTDKKDSEGNILSTENVRYVVYHQVFNLDQVVKVADCTSPDSDKSIWNKGRGIKLLSDRQKEFLDKLIRTKCKDQSERNWLLQELPSLTTSQANDVIKNLLNG